MKLPKPGKNISEAEVQSIAPNGLWMLVKGREYYLPFSEYPWFEAASVSNVYSVQLLHGQHLYWPKLDIDLALDSLQNLEKYPLISSFGLKSTRKHLRSAA